VPNLHNIWTWVLVACQVVIALAALLHVLLKKNDPRAAAYWVALIALVPLLGPVLYLLLGINFLRRRGKAYREAGLVSVTGDEDNMSEILPEWEAEVRAMPGLVRSLRMLSPLSLVGGNTVELLRDGDEAMPAMIAAVEQAQRSVTLATYIFEATGVGLRLIEALHAAHQRGVEVKVMIDDAGTRYSWPSALSQLRKRGIYARRFMPIRFFVRIITMNLRNHRKLLVVDGKIGFTGGMNIRQGNMLKEQPAHPTADTHFRIEGPAVNQLQRVFAEDWAFCTGERLKGEAYYPELPLPGDVSIIGLPDGPDEDVQPISFAIATALDEARREVRICTPYFLPPEPIFSALRSCALRGVKVSIILPAQNNVPLVHWAARTVYAPLLKRGCRIFEATGPFDHSKLFTVDGSFSMIGSTNWDPRSLRLNFEFNLACFDDQLAPKIAAEIDRKRATATEITLEMLNQQSLWERLRNGVARLLIPLL
jgi:cardiolipin synthase A/B